MSLGFLNILVVDDHSDTLTTISLMLRQAGVGRIMTANNAMKAMELLDSDEGRSVNVVLCDWNMPQMDGIQFLKHIRGGERHIPFIMVSARGDAESVSEAKDSDVNGYILKPFSIMEIQKKLQKIMDLARSSNPNSFAGA